MPLALGDAAVLRGTHHHQVPVPTGEGEVLVDVPLAVERVDHPGVDARGLELGRQVRARSEAERSMTCAWCPREALLTPFAVPVCARHFERAREIYDARHAARLQWPRAKAPPHDADELAGRAVDWSRPGPGWVPFTRT